MGSNNIGAQPLFSYDLGGLSMADKRVQSKYGTVIVYLTFKTAI